MRSDSLRAGSSRLRTFFFALLYKTLAKSSFSMSYFSELKQQAVKPVGFYRLGMLAEGSQAPIASAWAALNSRI